MGKKTLAAPAGVVIALILFLGIVSKPHPQMLACVFAILSLVALSYLFGSGPRLKQAKQSGIAIAFVFGAVSYPVFFISAIWLASIRAPAAAYFTILAANLIALMALSYY